MNVRAHERATSGHRNTTYSKRVISRHWTDLFINFVFSFVISVISVINMSLWSLVSLAIRVYCFRFRFLIFIPFLGPGLPTVARGPTACVVLGSSWRSSCVDVDAGNTALKTKPRARAIMALVSVLIGNL